MPSTDDSLRCSAGSAARHEPVGGTAPTARYWVVVEHPGPWAKQPLDTPPFDDGLGARLDASLNAHHAKVLLIRRTGRQPEEHLPKLWRIVDTLTARAISGCWQGGADLAALPDILADFVTDAPSDLVDEPAPPMILVCTHGVRDACCAIKGRPVAGLLSQAFGDEVWECSHLNGHRFAGTALVLPEGACYGRLAQADAVRVLSQHKVARLDAGHLRGLTRLSPPEQAAQVWALSELERLAPAAPRGVADITVGRSTPRDEDRTAVEVQGLGSPVLVEILREHLPPAPVSCGKGPEAATAYRVVGSTPA